MGDPRKIRKKYFTPIHPWQKERIEEEKKLKADYGLTNKEEIWRMSSILKHLKDQVKALASRTDKQSKLEEEQLVRKLGSLGLMNPDDPLDKVLGLNIESIMELRLQTIIVRKKLARTMKQARQFITHGHIIIGEKKITSPGYIVSLSENPLIQFLASSTLSKDDHPERMIQEVPKEKIEKKKETKKEEALPTFSEDEIEALEEKGAIEKSESKLVTEKVEEVKEKIKEKTEKKLKK